MLAQFGMIYKNYIYKVMRGYNMLAVLFVGGVLFIILHEISRKNQDWKLQRISLVIF